MQAHYASAEHIERRCKHGGKPTWNAGKKGGCPQLGHWRGKKKPREVVERMIESNRIRNLDPLERAKHATPINRRRLKPSGLTIREGRARVRVVAGWAFRYHVVWVQAH